MAVEGGWKLGPTIGRGATATVSLATFHNSGDLFAVKSSPISRSSLLRREQSILSSLSSPHIISCLGFDVTGDEYHLFLEFAAGGSISDLAGSLLEPKIRSFTRQILLAICYLHSNGVTHCDVKGRNVLVGADGCLKLADFGCARRVGESGLAMMGTPAFMAPEVARGEEQGNAGDIWSLGCTVIEMATGKLPWPEIGDPLVTIHRIGFSSDVPAVPEWLSDHGKDFVSKCLRRDPKQRWTAEQLLHHPFVSSAGESEDHATEQGKWVSPKSTLEIGLWESGRVDEDEETWSVDESSEERVLQLVSPPPNWTWDDAWVEVRTYNTDDWEEAANDEFDRLNRTGGEAAGGLDVDFFSYSLDSVEEMLEFSSSVCELEAGEDVILQAANILPENTELINLICFEKNFVRFFIKYLLFLFDFLYSFKIKKMTLSTILWYFT